MLYRTNARSAGFEQAFTEAGIPFQVREGGFLARQAVRRVRARLGSQSTGRRREPARGRVPGGAAAERPKELGEQERVRQADLSRLVDLAERFDDGERTVADFFADLEARSDGGEGRGVQLLTYHRAKGLEFDAVFLPKLEERELPVRRAKPDEARPRSGGFSTSASRGPAAPLAVTWAGEAQPVPGRARCAGGASGACAGRGAGCGCFQRPPRRAGSAGLAAGAGAGGGRAGVRRLPGQGARGDRPDGPATPAELAAVSGVGPAKLESYGERVLAELGAQSAGLS